MKPRADINRITQTFLNEYKPMRHLQPYHLFEGIDPRTLVSPSLSPITTYFETAQGSKYLLSKAGETKRWKSSHANTGGEDTGLKEWYPKSMFVPDSDINAMMAYEHLLNAGYKISISKTPDNRRVWVILKANSWTPALYSDAFKTYTRLNPEMASKPLVFTASPVPVMGYMAVEYKQDPSGLVRSFHPGSPVSKITPIEQADPKDLAHFNIK